MTEKGCGLTGRYDESRCRSACEHIARGIVRPLVQRYYRAEGLAVDRKADHSVMTEADAAIEREIRAFLAQAFPSYGLIGEELGSVGSRNEYVWTIDPIDGTEAFIAGVPLFGTLLAVVQQTAAGARVPVLGAIYLPVQDRLVIGNCSEATIDDIPVRLCDEALAGQRRLILGDISTIARTTPHAAQSALLRIAQRFRSTQTWGDCLGYLNMLEGNAQARIEAGLGVDDIAPLEPIILGAGGAVSTWNGIFLADALSMLDDLADTSASFTCVAASTRELHRELVGGLAARADVASDA
jgi:inositol-phosphate phosphatase/L-galactose 1-phosphate phosphatase/histidinol-phosphatase